MIRNMQQIVSGIDSSGWLEKYKEFGKKLLRQLGRENISDFESFERTINRIIAAFSEHLGEKADLTYKAEKQEPTVCVESADNAARRFAGENIELTKEIERLKAELRASETTYCAYIGGLQKDIQELKAKITPKPGEFISLADAIRGYKETRTPLEKVDIISFKNGDKKEVRYFEVFFTDIANERVINYRQTNGKNLQINASSIRYIEEL